MAPWWLTGKDPDAGKDCGQEKKGTTGWDGWMASPSQWTWVSASSRSWWRTGKPGVLQSMGSQKSRTRLSDWTELNWLGYSVLWLKLWPMQLQFIWSGVKFPVLLINTPFSTMGVILRPVASWTMCIHLSVSKHISIYYVESEVWRRKSPWKCTCREKDAPYLPKCSRVREGQRAVRHMSAL